jgi:polysaccharide export outer membrane protein
MSITAISRWLPRRAAFLLGLLLVMPVVSSHAQVPAPSRPGQALPSPDQAKQMLQNQPGLVDQLRQRISQSGLTPDQVRSRLRALGYPEDLLDQYLSGADTTAAARPSAGTLDAVRALGILSPQEADSLGLGDSLFAQSDSVRHLLDSLRMVHLDSLRADSLADSLERIRPTGLRIFGLTTFRKLTNQFEVPDNGPVDENYRLGPGDVLVLILTGDVERADMLEVTREGFVVIPTVGSLYVANLTMGQLEDQLYTRLGRVYSGIRRTPNARTKFQVSISSLRNIQVFVAGDVVRPGSYQISAAATVLNALYAAAEIW